MKDLSPLLTLHILILDNCLKYIMYKTKHYARHVNIIKFMITFGNISI